MRGTKLFLLGFFSVNLGRARGPHGAMDIALGLVKWAVFLFLVKAIFIAEAVSFLTVVVFEAIRSRDKGKSAGGGASSLNSAYRKMLLRLRQGRVWEALLGSMWRLAGAFIRWKSGTAVGKVDLALVGSLVSLALAVLASR